jgi:hypothetical protein
VSDEEQDGLDHGLDPTIESVETEYGIFSKGDRVEVVEDNEREGYFADMAGKVIGFEKIGRFNPAKARTAILVKFDGYDLIEVAPGDMRATA